MNQPTPLPPSTRCSLPLGTMRGSKRGAELRWDEEENSIAMIKWSECAARFCVACLACLCKSRRAAVAAAAPLPLLGLALNRGPARACQNLWKRGHLIRTPSSNLSSCACARCTWTRQSENTAMPWQARTLAPLISQTYIVRAHPVTQGRTAGKLFTSSEMFVAAGTTKRRG